MKIKNIFVLPSNDKFANIKNLFRMMNVNLLFSFRNNLKVSLLLMLQKLTHLVYVKLCVIIMVPSILNKLVKYYVRNAQENSVIFYHHPEYNHPVWKDAFDIY